MSRSPPGRGPGRRLVAVGRRGREDLINSPGYCSSIYIKCYAQLNTQSQPTHTGVNEGLIIRPITNLWLLYNNHNNDYYLFVLGVLLEVVVGVVLIPPLID